MSEEENTLRIVPSNDLDLNLMLTDSVWGKSEVPPELKNKLKSLYNVAGIDQPKDITDKASLWGLLGFFTRDMRLGNLSTFDNELQTCRYMIDLANDLLNSDMVEPFIIALSRSATILETSQSKTGFLRKNMNTLRQHNINEQTEPGKKGFMGSNKKNRGGF